MLLQCMHNTSAHFESEPWLLWNLMQIARDLADRDRRKAAGSECIYVFVGLAAARGLLFRVPWPIRHARVMLTPLHSDVKGELLVTSQRLSCRDTSAHGIAMIRFGRCGTGVELPAVITAKERKKITTEGYSRGNLPMAILKCECWSRAFFVHVLAVLRASTLPDSVLFAVLQTYGLQEIHPDLC